MEALAAANGTPDLPMAPRCATPVLMMANDQYRAGHRYASVVELARRIAAMRGSPLILHQTAGIPPYPCYAVPTGTLVGDALRDQLGIRTEADLFGGVVPFAVQAGKTITHSLFSDDATRPEGWCPEFGQAVRQVTLRGFAAFDRDSAQRAAEAMLPAGPVRLKAAWADGGHCQSIVSDVASVEAALDEFDTPELPVHGLVVEEDLIDVATYSVGRVRIGDAVHSYFGHQSTTKDNAGGTAYGGSVLTTVRGELDRLLALNMDPMMRHAIECAIIYDRAATAFLPGLIASRRNYDVVSGRDADGNVRIGVLEQSWRIGGASGAEIVAAEAFAEDPSLAAVCAVGVERYGAREDAPHDAMVYFEGDDPEVGSLMKYARIEARYRAL